MACPIRNTAACSCRRRSWRCISSLLGAGLTRRLGAKRIYLLGLLCQSRWRWRCSWCSRFVMHETCAGVRNTARGDRLLGCRIWLHGACAEYLCRGILPAKGREGRARVERVAGAGHDAGTGLRSVVRRHGNLVGHAVMVAAAIRPIADIQRGSTARHETRQPDEARGRAAAGPKLPARFWIFAAFALLYGMCETMNGNWASVYMKKQLGASAPLLRPSRSRSSGPPSRPGACCLPRSTSGFPRAHFSHLAARRCSHLR